MLRLARKLNQSVYIGDDVKLTILEIDGTYVRIGITAPRHVSIDRKEVRPRKLRNPWPVAKPAR